MVHKERLLGVIGGLGPLSTAHFMELVAEMTDAEKDQDHVDMIVYNYPSIPDSTAYILGYYRKNPVHGLCYVADALAQQRVDLIAMPCITAHYFYDELSGRVNVPIIHAVKETARYLRNQGIRRAGIMATEGTVSSGLYEKALAKEGIGTVLPSALRQQDISHLIYQNIKKNLPPEMDRFALAEQELRDRGAQVIILGCTELSLIKRDHRLNPGFLDSMEVLAQQTVLQCKRPLKPKYRQLITR